MKYRIQQVGNDPERWQLDAWTTANAWKKVDYYFTEADAVKAMKKHSTNSQWVAARPKFYDASGNRIDDPLQ